MFNNTTYGVHRSFSNEKSNNPFLGWKFYGKYLINCILTYAESGMVVQVFQFSMKFSYLYSSLKLYYILYLFRKIYGSSKSFTFFTNCTKDLFDEFFYVSGFQRLILGSPISWNTQFYVFLVYIEHLAIADLVWRYLSIYLLNSKIVS